MPSRITKQLTLWCGGCDTHACLIWMQMDVTSQADLLKFAKRRGWRKHSKHGWQCPACIEGMVARHFDDGSVYKEPYDPKIHGIREKE